MKKLLILLFLFPSLAFGLSISQPAQGGTGSSTLTGILVGNGTSPVNTLTIGTGLTLSGTTLTNSGITSNAGDWAGTWQTFSPSHFQVAGTYESVLTFNYPLSRSVNTISVAATSTFSSPLSYNLGTNAVSIQAASATQAGSMAAADYNRLYTATSTFSAPLSYSVASNAVTCTSASNGVAGCLTAADWGLLHTATSTFSAPLSYSVASNAVTCTSAANGVTGCMTAADWGYLHTATTTFSSPLSYSVSTNAVTIPAAGASTNGYESSAEFNYVHTATTTFSSPFVYTVSTNAVTCPTCIAGAWYPFNAAGLNNATSSIVNFTGGLTAVASSTIGATNATTTLLGNIMIGNAGLSGNILGSTTPFQVSGSYPNFMQTLLWNTNAGASASTDLVLNNNLSPNTNNAYYAEFGLNSGSYNMTAFTTQRPNDMFLISSDGGMEFELASSTLSNASSSFRFTTKGALSSNIDLELFNDGRLVMGTSTAINMTPFLIASSTAPQLVLSDNINTSGWSFRAISNSLFIATSTATATSTGSALYINPNGGVTVTSALSAGSLVLTGTPLASGSGGTGATSLSAAFGLNGTVFSNTVPHGFDMFATSSVGVWQAGTTTLHYTVTQTGTIVDFACKLFSNSAANLMQIQLGTGSASTTMAVASSTRGIMAASLAVTANTDLLIDVGATSTASFGVSASTTKDVSCSWDQRT